MRQLLRLNQPLDRLVQRHTGGDEDRGNHEQSRHALPLFGAENECDAKWHRRQRVTGVVDQIRQQRHRPGVDEDEHLKRGRDAEDAEADQNRADPFAGAQDRTVDEPVRFALVETNPAPDCVAFLEVIFAGGERLRISRGVDAATLQLVMTALRA